jgi:exonuclease SbcD
LINIIVHDTFEIKACTIKMKFKIVHTADIHFGMENYGFVDEKTGLHTRLIDFQRSFYFAIKKAIEINADCFIFAGDAYKNSHPTPTHQKILLQCFSKLIEAQIPIVIVVGNHDYPGNDSKAHALDVFNFLKIHGCHVFDTPGVKTIETKSGKINIVGIPWPSKKHFISHSFATKHSQNLNSLVQDVKNFINNCIYSINTQYPSVLVGHVTVEGGTFSGSERPVSIGKDPIFSVSDLRCDFFDYIALGHLHRFQNLNKKNGCPVIYSGSPEKIDFGEINDEKSFCIVDIDYDCKNNKKTSYETIKTPSRPMYEIVFDETDKEKSIEMAEEEIKQLLVSHAIIKIMYIYNKEKIGTFDHLVDEVSSNCWFFAGINYKNMYEHKRISYDIDHISLDIFDLVKNYSQHHESHKQYIDYYIDIINKYI